MGKAERRISDLNARMGKLSAEALPEEAREALTCLFNQIDDLKLRLHAPEADNRLAQGQRSQPAAGSRAGSGPITATALVAAVGDRTQFKSARHLAAWLGLTPRVRASGEKERIGRSPRGRLPDVADPRRESGGRDDVPQRGDGSAPGLAALVNRRPVKVAATAVARKTARVLWAMLTRCEAYRRSAGLSAAA